MDSTNILIVLVVVLFVYCICQICFPIIRINCIGLWVPCINLNCIWTKNQKVIDDYNNSVGMKKVSDEESQPEISHSSI